MSEQNKQLVRRFFEQIDTGEPAILDEFVAQGYDDHNPPPFPDLPPGIDGARKAFNLALDGFLRLQARSHGSGGRGGQGGHPHQGLWQAHGRLPGHPADEQGRDDGGHRRAPHRRREDRRALVDDRRIRPTSCSSASSSRRVAVRTAGSWSSSCPSGDWRSPPATWPATTPGSPATASPTASTPPSSAGVSSPKASPPMAIPQGDGTVQCLSGDSSTNVQKARGHRGQVRR